MQSLDLVGASSFVWEHKHNSLHHTYSNIDEHDDDIDSYGEITVVVQYGFDILIASANISRTFTMTTEKWRLETGGVDL